MSKHLLQIDLSSTYKPDDNNLVKIELKNEDTIQIHFWKFFYLSKYIQDKYKYSEAINSIQAEEPVALFGLYYNDAAINNEGEIIFIDCKSVKNSPDSHISSFSLPDGEKASSVACCDNTIVALSRNGRVFTSKIKNGQLNFSKSDSLSSEEINNISGTSNYCLAVSKTGRVFGFGSNNCGQLGLSKETREFSTFTELSSLRKYEITAAFAGCYHSFFVTSEGKILSCGQNGYGQLFLKNSNSGIVYSPTETTITDNSLFFILGNCLTVSFIDGDPPPNTPNMKIQYHQ